MRSNVSVRITDSVSTDTSSCRNTYTFCCNEPEGSTLSQAIKSLKQGGARQLALRAAEPFWQARYYDFNVWSEATNS